jgi:hypothetical protein
MSNSVTPSRRAQASSMSRGTARSASSSGRPSRARLQQQVRGRGGGHDDVRGHQGLRQLVERDRGAVVAARQADRAIAAAIGHEHGGGPAVGQRTARELARLAGADDDHAPAPQVTQMLAGEGHGGAGQAQLPLADRRLGAHPLARGQRGPEQAVGERAGRVPGQRRLVGALDLTLDLGLADQHGLQARDDAVEVAGGVAVAVRVDRGGQLGGPDPGLAGQHRQHGGLGLHGVPDHEVQLGAVARRDGHRLVHLGLTAQIAQELHGARVGQRETLADLHGRGLVRDADGQQLAHRTASVSRSVAA